MDILLTILESYMNSLDIEQSVIDQSKPPARLTQVCQHWRDVVVNAPTLWTRISISNCTLSPPSLRALRRHIEYSKAAPLQIALIIKEDPFENICEPLASWEAVSLIVREALPRCRSLHIHFSMGINQDRGDFFFPPGSQTHMPLLESLSTLYTFNAQSRDAQIHAPRLKSVDLYKMDTSRYFELFPSTTASILDLSLYGLNGSPEALASVLRYAQNNLWFIDNI